MESKEQQESWPVIGRLDVADLCQEICESILELEHAFEAGELSSRLTSGCLEQMVGPLLYEAYGRLADSTPGPLHHLRVDAVRALVAELRNDLIPIQVAHAEVRMPVEGDSSATEPRRNSPVRLPFKLVDAHFDGGPRTTLRIDQMFDVRFWRIGFMFDKVDLCDAFARAIVRSATTRLASELLSVQRILERFNPKTLNGELRIVPAE